MVFKQLNEAFSIDTFGKTLLIFSSNDSYFWIKNKREHFRMLESRCKALLQKSFAEEWSPDLFAVVVWRIGSKIGKQLIKKHFISSLNFAYHSNFCDKQNSRRWMLFENRKKKKNYKYFQFEFLRWGVMVIYIQTNVFKLLSEFLERSIIITYFQDWYLHSCPCYHNFSTNMYPRLPLVCFDLNNLKGISVWKPLINKDKMAVQMSKFNNSSMEKRQANKCDSNVSAAGISSRQAA